MSQEDIWEIEDRELVEAVVSLLNADGLDMLYQIVTQRQMPDYTSDFYKKVQLLFPCDRIVDVRPKVVEYITFIWRRKVVFDKMKSDTWIKADGTPLSLNDIAKLKTHLVQEGHETIATNKERKDFHRGARRYVSGFIFCEYGSENHYAILHLDDHGTRLEVVSIRGDVSQLVKILLQTGFVPYLPLVLPAE